MKIRFHYIKSQDGTISHLNHISPSDNGGTYGDELLASCLRDYQISDDKKGFKFRMEYDSRMQAVLGYLSNSQ